MRNALGRATVPGNKKAAAGLPHSKLVELPRDILPFR
jgi:hypothetical protein